MSHDVRLSQIKRKGKKKEEEKASVSLISRSHVYSTVVPLHCAAALNEKSRRRDLRTAPGRVSTRTFDSRSTPS